MSYNLTFGENGVTGNASGSGNLNLSGLAGVSSKGLASLQTPATDVAAANQVSTNSNVTPAAYTGGNAVQMPSWLNTNPDSNLSELLAQYGSTGAAYDSMGQAQNKAYNDSIGYTVGAGSQAANNAANEYVNRAAQSGGSALGAGAVKAQAMMPTYKAANDLRVEGVNKAAETQQKGLDLSAQIAKTIGDLRNSYLGTLAQYADSQSKAMTANNQFNSELSLKDYQARQGVASNAAERQQGYASLQNDWNKAQLTAYNQTNNTALQAAGMLTDKAHAPTGFYQTDQWGRVTSGQDSYDKIKNYGQQQNAAYSALGGMLQNY
jgi:hypothetical protein